MTAASLLVGRLRSSAVSAGYAIDPGLLSTISPPAFDLAVNTVRIWTGVLQEGEKFSELVCQKKAEESTTAKAKSPLGGLSLSREGKSLERKSKDFSEPALLLASQELFGLK